MIVEKLRAIRRLMVAWLMGGFVLVLLNVGATIGWLNDGHSAIVIAREWATFFPWLVPGLIILVGLMRLRAGEMTSLWMAKFTLGATVAYQAVLLLTWACFGMHVGDVVNRPYHQWLLLSYVWVLPLQIALDFMLIRMIRS